MSNTDLHIKLKEDILKEFGDKILSAEYKNSMTVVYIKPEVHVELPKWLKDHPTWLFNHFIDITAVDYFNSRKSRFEVVVQLRSHTNNIRVRIHTEVPDEKGKPSLPTLQDTYIGASWSEREVWDMFGIDFTGHPRMERVLMPDDYEGHPLRKDFPVQGPDRDTFPRGTVISNKVNVCGFTPDTRPGPVDQILPVTPEEKKNIPAHRGGDND